MLRKTTPTKTKYKDLFPSVGRAGEKKRGGTNFEEVLVYSQNVPS
jgi:hypothetical protein